MSDLDSGNLLQTLAEGSVMGIRYGGNALMADTWTFGCTFAGGSIDCPQGHTTHPADVPVSAALATLATPPGFVTVELVMSTQSSYYTTACGPSEAQPCANYLGPTGAEASSSIPCRLMNPSTGYSAFPAAAATTVDRSGPAPIWHGFGAGPIEGPWEFKNQPNLADPYFFGGAVTAFQSDGQGYIAHPGSGSVLWDGTGVPPAALRWTPAEIGAADFTLAITGLASLWNINVTVTLVGYAVAPSEPPGSVVPGQVVGGAVRPSPTPGRDAARRIAGGYVHGGPLITPPGPLNI